VAFHRAHKDFALNERAPGVGFARRSNAGAVMRLQRAAGNQAVKRVLARNPRKPYQHQWENPALVETIYPARDIMLKKFVNMYREIELGDMTDPAERKKLVDSTRAAMQQEIEKLKSSASPSKKDLARIKELELILKRGESNGDKAWRDAVDWERKHHADPLAGDKLMEEVKRLFGTSGVPDWLKPMVLDYSGMRYKSAHGSYYSPVRLLYLIERQRGTWSKARAEETEKAAEAHKAKVTEWETGGKKGRKPAAPKKIKEAASETAALGMSSEDAIARLEKMREAGEIPDWAWHKIVRLTELRTWYADTGWESTDAEKHAADNFWDPVMTAWTGKERIGNLGRGITGWRSEIHRRNALITTRMVCNELSEATQRQRGIELVGGISKNAEQYVKAAGQTPGAYFKQPSSLADFKPGAGLFWVNRSLWEATEPDDSNKVRAIAGAKFPMPPPPEYVSEWKAWKEEQTSYEKNLKAWERKSKAAKTDEQKAKLGEAPKKPDKAEPQYLYKDRKLLPNDGEVVHGWTYTVKVGQPITRTKDGVTHWLRWQHQATVLRAMPDGRIFTFETTDALEGSAKLGVSGFGVRTLDALSIPGVFVGYIPGEGEVVETPATETSTPTEVPMVPVPMLQALPS
jgi:hypothetical protein